MHPTIALSEGQIYTVVKATAEDSVTSSFDMMKSLLMKMTEGIPLDNRLTLKLPPRAGTPAPGYDSSSGEERTIAETDGYTSRAFNSDEDLNNLETSSECNCVRFRNPLDNNGQPRIVRDSYSYFWEQC